MISPRAGRRDITRGCPGDGAVAGRVIPFGLVIGISAAPIVVVAAALIINIQLIFERHWVYTASTAVGNTGVGSWIERRARAAPDHVALIAGDRSLTYSELGGRVRRLANGLRALGVAKGDRVAWLRPNHPAFLESLFAAGLLGAALAPVNHRLDEAETAGFWRTPGQGSSSGTVRRVPRPCATRDPATSRWEARWTGRRTSRR